MMTRPGHMLTCGMVSLCVAAAATAQTAAVVRTLDTTATAGTVTDFATSDGLTLRAADGQSRTIAPRDLVWIDFAPQPIADDPDAFCIVTADGGRCDARLVGQDAAALVVRTRLLGERRLRLEALRGFLTPTGRRDDAATRRAWIEQPADDDAVWLANGDKLTGAIEQVAGDGLVIRSTLGATTVQFDVLLAARWAGKPRSATAPLRVTFADGSRLNVQTLRFADGTWRVTAGGWDDGEHPVGVPIRRIEPLDGRWVWLDGLTPIESQQHSATGLSLPVRHNRNVAGGPLRVGGTAFEHGLGVRSRSVLVYDLAGRFERFVARAGLDDSAGPLADVAAEVRVDGKTVWSKKNLRPGRPPAAIDVSVGGARRLELIADYGLNASIQDRFNWADAALIRGASNRQ